MTDLSVGFVCVMIVASFFAGATASVVGFGIGSLLTPLVALRLGTERAIVIVALPHLAGSLVRGVLLRHAIDRSVLVRFGILSAVGGLAGALLFARLRTAALTPILGLLLVMTATAGLTGWSTRWHPRGAMVAALGVLSGLFGGVVGNQGGLRAAALSALGLAPAVFVATSTAIGVIIDLVRTPFYLVHGGETVVQQWPLIVACAAGVVAGTRVGERLLLGIPPERFRLAVSIAIGLLGLWFLFRPQT